MASSTEKYGIYDSMDFAVIAFEGPTIRRLNGR